MGLNTRQILFFYQKLSHHCCF